MRTPLVIVALAALLAGAAPAAADAPASGFGRRPAVAHRPLGPLYAPPPRHYGYGAPRHRHHGGYRAIAAGPSYGPLPPFFGGMGNDAAHLTGTPVGLTLYREAYIGRGLIYNTPPTLDVPGPILGGRY